jgi:hypothetical protein
LIDSLDALQKTAVVDKQVSALAPPDPRPLSPQKRISPRRESQECSSPTKRTRSNEDAVLALPVPAPGPPSSNSMPKPARRKGFTIRDFHLEAVIDHSHPHRPPLVSPSLVSVPSQEPNSSAQLVEGSTERHSEKKKKKKHKQDAFVEEDFDFPGESSCLSSSS